MEILVLCLRLSLTLTFNTPYIQYEQIKLKDTFNKYVTKALQSKRVLRTGIKPTPFRKTFEINVGAQSHIVEFKGANKEFSFVEISLVYDKNEQHNTYMTVTMPRWQLHKSAQFSLRILTISMVG